MKYLNGKYYVKVKDKSVYHSSRGGRNSKRTETTKIFENSISYYYYYTIKEKSKNFQNENDELGVKFYPKRKKKQKFEKPKLDVECPICRSRKWIDFDKS